MKEQDDNSWRKFARESLNRRTLLRGAAGAALGAGFLGNMPVHADHNDDGRDRCQGPILKPIPSGVAPFKPFGVMIHHHPLVPAAPLANIGDPSQITDFDGFVGLTHILGGGTGTDAATGVTTPLAYGADMGFAQGKFIGTDGRIHKGTFAFV